MEQLATRTRDLQTDEGIHALRGAVERAIARGVSVDRIRSLLERGGIDAGDVIPKRDVVNLESFRRAIAKAKEEGEQKAMEVKERAGTFGVTLTDLRRQRRLSQSKLADLAGCDHSYISRIESGVRMCTRDFLAQIATVMDLTDEERIRLFNAAGFLAPGEIVDRDAEIRIALEAIIAAESAISAANVALAASRERLERILRS